MEYIQIKNIEIFHGGKIQDNTIYLNHFKEQGKDIKHFMEDIMGRKKRYLLESPDENALTMAIEASKKVLNSANLNGNDMDMIILCSVLPQYVTPPSSILIHRAIGGKQECFCNDINVNCIGMAYALNLITGYMKSDSRINRALIVGSDFLNPQVSPDNELCYGEYGDAACAIILEKTSRECGVIDSKIATDTSAIDDVYFPHCGFSNIYDVPKENIHAKWVAHPSNWYESSLSNIKSVLRRNNVTVDDISMFCFSQFTYKTIVNLRKDLNIPEENSMYIGDIYGYTGTTSPFIALYESIKKGKIKRGDYILLWTLAAGTSTIVLLLKY